ncbi:MAG: prephenate dehydrogenase/arogenate dehydrogenase family protein [Methylococcaceae bacterium]|nr:MAG: prephenate dehydrogenase/arogenate dehydrogenase family protein [Methylococcaceae bacterium]
MIERLCLIGVGLIGGSLARAIRRAGWCKHIVGVDADAAVLQRAQVLGVIDQGCTDVAEGARRADVVLIAVPVQAMEAVLSALKPVWNPQTVYTDVGSTKLSVVEAAQRVFGSVPGNFVPGHPIAGAELSGVDAAQPDLFRGKRVILTPLPETQPAALHLVAQLWQCAGAEVAEMEPARHDQVLAATSHLPHVTAFALVDCLGREDETEAIFRYAAGGFRDFTRIASSDPVMWRDICLANRGPILARIQSLRQELADLAALIEAGEGTALLQRFQRARQARQRFLAMFENNHNAQ